MQQSEQINELAAALAKAQADIKTPKRNREVKVQTRTGGSYTFKYATLDEIIDCIRKPLTSNGLWFTQGVVSDYKGGTHLVTTLTHASGQWMKSEIPVALNGSNQEQGSELTYKRRYAITAMLALASEEDDDANLADGNTVTASKGRGNASKSAQDASRSTQMGDPVSVLPFDSVRPVDGSVTIEPPSPAKAALQPVIHAADMLNGWLEEIAKEHGRDIKDVRKYAKQYMKMEFPQDDVKTMTPERASVIAMRLVEIFRKDAAEQKELA